jgi:integrase
MQHRSLPNTFSSLRDAALAPSTHRAYNRNLDNFLHFTRLTLPHLLQLPSIQIDQRLSAYFEHDFQSKGSYNNACHTLFGLIFHCPRLKTKLGESRLRLRGWRRLVRCKSHPPITWELAVLFATVLAKWGHHAEAVGTLLSFDCYLRVSELTKLRYSDVVMPGDPRTGSAHRTMALRLAVTKTGLNQWVSLGRERVTKALLFYLNAFPFLSDSLVFPFTPSSFRSLLRAVSSSLGLGHIPYVPHSFRHGGATCDYLRGATIEQIMFRGRWVAMESARRYIQTSRALLIMLDIPAELNQAGLVLAPRIADMLHFLMESVPLRRSRLATAPRRIRRRVRFADPS